MHTKRFYIFLALSFTIVINTFAQDLSKNSVDIQPKERKDSLNISVNRVLTSEIETSEKLQDTTKTDSIKKPKGILEGVVDYKAKDYSKFNMKEKRLYLYNEAEINYLDMNIKAGIIVIDYNKNEVYAGRIKDSAGNYSQAPIFKQGENLVEPDSIRFNYKTEKALVFNSKTEQSGFNIIAPITKKENDSVVFMYKGRFTTAEDIEDPEYYFQSTKIKLQPNQKIVVGPTNMVIADVPTPIGLPFAFFPLTDKQTSGLIIPSFGEDANRGYNLQNGGYYFAISDNIDLAVLGSYFTNGSYNLRLESTYNKRYRFNGRFDFRYENLITSERGFPNYGKNTLYNIRWSHSQDAKASPNSRFSASVNLGSSNYYTQSINQFNAANRQNNNLSSSVSYSKTFQGEPQVNFSLAATHSQNSQSQAVNMTLPTLQASVSRIFPFAPKVGTKKGILQNINFQYNLRGENRYQTTDSLFFKSEMFKNARTGLQHSIPISTNFKVLKYLSVSAGTSFTENWVFKTIERRWNQVNQEVFDTDIRGFDAYRTYNFSASLGTTLYGMFDFEKKGKTPKIQKIRHVMRPSISYSINPAFNNYYETYAVIDADGTTLEEYSRFENSLYGAPNKNYSSSIGLSLANTIEAKVRDRDTTATEPKKITLLNSLNFSTAYNLAGDSLQISPLRMTGGTSLFKNKMSVNFGAVFDPYALDNNNTKIDKFNIDNGGSLFRLTSANLTMNYSFDSKSFSGKNRNNRSQEENIRSGGRADDLFGTTEDFADQRFQDNDDKEEVDHKFYNYGVPWSLRLAYAINYNNTRRQNEISSHSLMFSGDVELSPRWSVGISSGYDLKNKGINQTQLRFARDLLSWRMNFSMVLPASGATSVYSRSWNFFIGIKSNVLSDLKYEERRQPDQRL